MNHLFEVTEYEATRPRVFIVWTDQWDIEAFDNVSELLEQQEFRVLNRADEMFVDEIDLRSHLPVLAAATHIALDDTWWTSAPAHQLVQVAGWLGLAFIDHIGRVIPTASLKGRGA